MEPNHRTICQTMQLSSIGKEGLRTSIQEQGFLKRQARLIPNIVSRTMVEILYE